MAPEPDPERGVVFQKYSVFPHLTVLQNLMLPFELEGIVLLAAGERFVTFGRWLIASASEVWAGLSAILGAGCIFVALSRLGTF